MGICHAPGREWLITKLKIVQYFIHIITFYCSFAIVCCTNKLQPVGDTLLKKDDQE